MVARQRKCGRRTGKRLSDGIGKLTPRHVRDVPTHVEKYRRCKDGNVSFKAGSVSSLDKAHLEAAALDIAKVGPERIARIEPAEGLIGGVATAKFYTVTMVASSNTGTNYTFTAVPSGDQAKDSCGTLTLKMEVGVLKKEPTTEGCW